MTTEMQQKLQGYMMETGAYDTIRILEEIDGMTHRNAKFTVIFNTTLNDFDVTAFSAEFQAAFEYNAHRNDEIDQVEASAVDAVLSADEIDWNAADSLKLTQSSDAVDGEDRPVYRQLTHEAQARRTELRSGIKPASSLFADMTEEDLAAKGL